MNTISKAFFLFFLLLFSAFPAQAQDWSYQLEPYILASSIDGDSSMGRATGTPVGVNFGDILEVLDTGFMVHFEAQNSNGWGLSLDYGFMDLRQDGMSQLGGVADVRLRQGVFEALLTRRHERGNGHVDYFGGFRWWDNDITLNIDPAIFPGSLSVDINEDWIDLVVGARMMKPVSDDWKFYMHGDIGGLGIQADWTGAVSVGFGYTISDLMELDINYKAMWVDYEDGNFAEPGYYAYDTVTHGPKVGLVFKF